MASDRYLSAKQVAAMLGKESSRFAHDRMKRDSSFPKHAKEITGKGGCQYYWSRAELLNWKMLDDARRKDAMGRRLRADGSTICQHNAFAGEMAVQFICGWFDPPHKQIDRRRRIERARLKGVKNRKQIRTEGDWQ